jgi:membrane-associated phospholipid phosphatase
MGRPRWLLRLGLTGAFSLATNVALAEPAAEPSELVWKWPRFRTSEYIGTGVVGAAAIGVFFFAGLRDEPRWTGGILFDDAVRDAVRVRSREGTSTVRRLSDVTAIGVLVLTLGVDSLAVPLLRGSSDVAGQLLLLDAEALAVNSLFTTSAFDLIARARPSYDECRKDPTSDELCGVGTTASFWSGHTAQAFTAAGLSCAHHAYAKIYGSTAADVLGCAGAISLSAATGTFRVLGDRHYASDVLVGAVVGFGIGYGMPTLLHYTAGDEPRRVGIAVVPSTSGVSLGATGRF